MAVVGTTIGKPWGRRLPVSVGVAGVLAPAYSAAYEVLDFAGVLSGGTPRYMLNGTDVANAAAVGYTGTGTFNASGYTANGTQGIGKTQAIGSGQDFIILCEYDAPATDIARLSYNASGTPQGPQHYRLTSGTYGNSPSSGLPNGGAFAGATVRNVFGRSGGLAKQCFNGQPVGTGGGFNTTITNMVIGNNDSTGSGSSPWGVPIKRWVMWLGTYSDAEIAALAG